MLEKGNCFPLFKYIDESTIDRQNMFNQNSIFGKGIELSQNNINQKYITSLQEKFNSSDIDSERIFYYIYAILHSKEYRKRFKNNTMKSLARIPIVNKKEDFFKFSEYGKELGFIHLNFEDIEMYKCNFKEGDLRLLYIDDPKKFYRVEKMKFPNKSDKSTIVYNQNLTIQNIPLEVYDYVVNGKSAIEWVMERQSVKTHKATGILNDANDYANETKGNPAYPLELIQRMITVSLETMRIIKALPKLDID